MDYSSDILANIIANKKLIKCMNIINKQQLNHTFKFSIKWRATSFQITTQKKKLYISCFQ